MKNSEARNLRIDPPALKLDLQIDQNTIEKAESLIIKTYLSVNEDLKLIHLKKAA
jgi:hypothetical protein